MITRPRWVNKGVNQVYHKGCWQRHYMHMIMMTSSNGNTFRVTGPLCGEFTVPVNSPHKGQWCGALMFSLICAWINDWINSREAGDLRRHRGHYDVNVMYEGLCLVVFTFSSHPDPFEFPYSPVLLHWYWGNRIHDDVIKWKKFPRYWPFVRGIHWSPVNSPHKGQWRGALMFTLICARINGWVNNGEAGDLRRHRAHYDVIVMIDPVPVK